MLRFRFWVYDSGQWVYQNEHVTGPHNIYTTYSTPLAPMTNPWTDVIERACTWCNGLSSASSISDQLVYSLYDAGWVYDPTKTHTVVASWSSQTLKLSEMLSSTWADCKDFGNFYTCLARSLGVDGQAYFVEGPFSTKPVLGSNKSAWETFVFNHHQFGWQSSLVHDASIKVDHSAPKYPVNMDRDTTYKGYLVATSPPPTWNPRGSVVCSVTSSLLGLSAASEPLQASNMKEFELEGTIETKWHGDPGPVSKQSWRHVESGALLEVEFANFESSELAAKACHEQVRWTEAMPAVGAFSGGTIGDECWHWMTDRSARLLFRSGSCAVDLFIVGSQLPKDAGILLEDVAYRVLRNVR